ncbi:MAG: FTR1 family protein [Pseudoxanthomonas sp.]
MLNPTFVAPFLIMLREGIEAALIVGIIASYLRQTGRRHAMPWVWAGIVLAVLLCAAVAAVIVWGGHEYPQKQQELLEGVVALVAVAILTSMVFWMKKAGRSIKGELQQSIDRALEKGGNGWTWGLVGMAFLAVAREGLESLFFLLAIMQQDPTRVALVGASLGLALAVALGFGMYYGSIRMNLQRFFRITSVFIIFVAAGLLAGALTKLHEAGVWNHLQAIAFDWTQTLPVYSVAGSVLAAVFGYNDHPTVGEVAAYLLYLLPVLWLYFRGDRQGRPARAPQAT